MEFFMKKLLLLLLISAFLSCKPMNMDEFNDDQCSTDLTLSALFSLSPNFWDEINIDTMPHSNISTQMLYFCLGCGAKFNNEQEANDHSHDQPISFSPVNLEPYLQNQDSFDDHKSKISNYETNQEQDFESQEEEEENDDKAPVQADSRKRRRITRTKKNNKYKNKDQSSSDEPEEDSDDGNYAPSCDSITKNGSKKISKNQNKLLNKQLKCIEGLWRCPDPSCKSAAKRKRDIHRHILRVKKHQ